jgi:molecular chaperone GrpE
MYWDGNNQASRRIPVRVVRETSIPGSAMERSVKVDEMREHTSPVSDGITAPAASDPDWQALALRLQADMDNYRKRQARRADEAIGAERERLLRLIIPVVDNLARALSQDGRGDEALRQEGVAPIEVIGRPFDPELHEAVATAMTDAKAGTVVKELERGYVLGEKLLRPARVVVAA